MTETKSRYFLQEQEAWQRTLDYIQQQNIAMKNSLAQISGNLISNELLEKLEYFQNQFLGQDTLIVLLRRDISEQIKLSEIDLVGVAHTELLQKQEKLRSDMKRIEKDFSSLKFDFNHYMAQVL